MTLLIKLFPNKRQRWIYTALAI